MGKLVGRIDRDISGLEAKLEEELSPGPQEANTVMSTGQILEALTDLSLTTERATSSVWLCSTTSITMESGSTMFPATTRNQSSVSPKHPHHDIDEEFSSQSLSRLQPQQLMQYFSETKFCKDFCNSGLTSSYCFLGNIWAGLVRGDLAVFIIYTKDSNIVTMSAAVAFIHPNISLCTASKSLSKGH